MATSTRAALIQMCSTPDVAANLECAGRLIADAADSGASAVLLPEAFAFIGPDAEKRRILEHLDADRAPTPILDWCRGIARRHRIDLVVGGFHEASEQPDLSYNTCVHLRADGTIAARYRKIHLFDVELDDGTALRESARTLPGTQLVTTTLDFGVLGLSVCYDLRFPYVYQALTDRGAVALAVPSAFTATTGAAHWHPLLRARAIENQCWVLAPAQHGHHHGKRVSYGHSVVIDPWGEVVAELPEGDGVVVADIDPARVAAVRRQLPSLCHRRPLG